MQGGYVLEYRPPPGSTGYYSEPFAYLGDGKLHRIQDPSPPYDYYDIFLVEGTLYYSVPYEHGGYIEFPIQPQEYERYYCRPNTLNLIPMKYFSDGHLLTTFPNTISYIRAKINYEPVDDYSAMSVPIG